MDWKVIRTLPLFTGSNLLQKCSGPHLMNKFLYYLYQPYKWLIFLPVALAMTFIFGILALIFLALTNPKLASYVGGVLWARSISFLTPLSVRVKGREHIDPLQSYVIISNHQSIYDIFILYGWLGVDFKWVMKKEIRKFPIVGISCEKIGHIFIDRSNREAAVASLQAARSRISNGTSIIFFPEGTRSTKTTLREFKKGAFKTALQFQLPILPITIKGSQRILPTQTLDLLPGRVEMIIHPPIDIAKYKDDELPVLLTTARVIIQSALDDK
jgi:1-acyl-sn-glycerol-3-phosphate acyltransferase